VIAIVQGVAVVRRRELLRFFPAAIGATAAALLAGAYLLLGAEFRWVSGELLDDLALPVVIAGLWWIFHNRMGSKRNRAG
jgi:hypothetical protein